MSLKQTPLNAVHREMGARMVDFGGWDMPVNYGSQIEEHNAVRNSVGMFDVSHMRVVDIKGAGTRAFLRGLVANNVDKLKEPGKALYSCMLNPAGGVIDDLIIYFLSEDYFRIVVNAGTADKDIAWMQQQAKECGADCVITPKPELAMIAVQGPKAWETVWQVLPQAKADTEKLKPFQAAFVGEWMLARTGYTGEDGTEIMLPATEADALWRKLAAAGAAPAGLGARDTLRLEAGMNLYGQDMDENTSPLEAGLAWTVDLSPGRDFIGRAALEQNPPTKQMVGLLLLDKGVLRGHQVVQTAKGAGEITSGTFSPTLNRSIAMACVPAGVALGDEVKVEVRDKLLAARVVKYPFARQGKALIALD